MNWLGNFDHLPHYQREHPDPHLECFPDGALNAKQLDMVLTLNDPDFGRIVAVGHGAPQPILKLTEEITEVHLQIGQGRDFMKRRTCVLWLNVAGKQIAAAIWVGKQRDELLAKSYWIKPEDMDVIRSPDWEPIVTEHEDGMWSLGNHGAVPLTRQFIKEHYTS
jgi:hypothetical protein